MSTTVDEYPATERSRASLPPVPDGAVMLTVNIHIGAFVTVNRVCNISHDCRVGDFSTIAPATNLSGAVAVGTGCDIGSGVTTVQGVRVGEWTIIGAGAVIAADVPANCTAVGVPARPIKQRESGWQHEA